MFVSKGLVVIGLLVAPANAWADISGRVVGPGGGPVPGAAVSVYDPEDEQARAERQAGGRLAVPLATAKTADDGSFTLTGSRSFVWLEAQAAGQAPSRRLLLDETAPLIVLRPAPLRRGVITARGKPVAGAIVVWTSFEGVERISRTGPDGAYEAPDPQAAPAELLVLHSDFAPQTARLDFASKLDLELKTGTVVAGSVIDHASGKPVAGATVWIDRQAPVATTDAAGAFRLRASPEWRILTARASRAMGSATREAGPLVVRLEPERSLYGTISDAKSGQPVAGAGVLGWRDDGGFIARTVTGALGQYTIGGLPPGRYVVNVERPGFVEVRTLCRPTGGVDLRTEVSGRCDVALTPLPRLRGQVEDEQGRPIEGAAVSMRAGGTPPLYGQSAAFPGTAAGFPPPVRTAADGSFALVLPEYADLLQRPGDAGYSLIVLKPGYAAGRLAPKASAGPLLIKLSRGVELKGRIASGDGKPLAGVAIILAETGLTPTRVATHAALADLDDPGWTKSDAAGRFSVRVHPVAHDLSFRKAGFAPKIVREQHPRPGGELVVTLEGPAAIRGRVSRADGSGVPSVEVSVYQLPGQEPRKAVTATDGTFAIRGLAVGSYELVAQHTELGIDERQTVEAPASAVRIVLQPRGILRGRILDAASRKPVPRFRLSLVPEAPTEGRLREVGAQDESGAFAARDLSVGAFTLHVTADGYLAGRLEGVRVAADPVADELEIVLDPDTPIRGRVTDAAGKPVGRVDVIPQMDGTTRVAAVRSGDDGRFEVRGLPAGEVVVGFRAAGFLDEEKTLDTRAAAWFDVVLNRGLSLEGVVVRGGAGVAEAEVIASPGQRDAPEQRSFTDERGRFRLTGLAPGRYTFEARDREDSVVAKDVDVERPPSPLRLVLGAAGTLIGKVVGLPRDDDGRRVTVRAAAENGRSFHAVVDGSHSFRFPRLPAGRVELQAEIESASGARLSRKLETTVVTGQAAEATLEFPAGVVVSGRVLRDGAPVAGARVFFAGPSGQGCGGRTDGRGIYEVGGLELGAYTVRAWTDDGPSIATEHVVTAAGHLDLDITVGGLSGRVVRADNAAALPGVTVSIFRVGAPDGPPDSSTLTDEHGVFRVHDLGTGRYRLVAALAGFTPATRELELRPGENVEVVFEVRAAGDEERRPPR